MSDYERSLREFVERARRRGASYQETRRRLVEAGWQSSIVDDLLPKLYVEAEHLAPSPAPGVSPPSVAPAVLPPPARPTRPTTSDGINAWVNKAWAMVAGDPWPFIGASVIAGFLSLTVICAPPLIVGMNRMLLKKHDGEAVGVGDVFEGFRYFGSSWGFALLLAVPWFVLSGVVQAIMGQAQPGSDAPVVPMFMMGLLEIVLLVIGPFFVLGFPFIADDRGGAIEAVAESWSAVKTNFINYLIALVVFQIIAFIGYILCGIGVFFTVPLASGCVVAMYRSRFPASA